MTSDPDPIPTPLAAALAERYRIERAIGVGGMATVFLAHDRRHDRPVAIKVMHPELAVGLGAERFVREIAIAARLRHPHILPLYDSGEAAGTPWYVMPFVAGESLRERLARDGALPVDEALRLAREVADALACAHAQGVVHRDIKPENVLLDAGHAVVADFGIARAVALATRGGDAPAASAHGAPPAAPMTRTGVSLGTPTYMSPEQAAGDREVDGRSDQYALACVLHELLAGAPPFTGPVALVLRRHLLDAAPDVRAARPDVPAHVAAALARALAKEPADRFATVADFARALDAPAPAGGSAARAVDGPTDNRAAARRRAAWALAGAAALVALAGGALARRATATEAAAAPGGDAAALDQKYTVAVLPFESLSADTTKRWFAAGLTEEVTAQLSRLSALRVIGRGALGPVGDAPDRLARLGRELDVGSVVEGSVRVQGDSARVAIRLTDTRTGQVIWSRDVNLALADALLVQGQAASAIADALQARLTPAEARRAGRAPTISLAAYERYARAQRVPGGTAARLREAIGLLRQAVAIDPAFARAHAALAQRYVFLAYADGSAYVDSGLVAARAAIAADPDLPHGHFVLGDLESIRGRLGAARASYHRALELDPNFASAMNDLSVNEDIAGHYDESLHWGVLAFARVPNRPHSHYHVAYPLTRIADDSVTARVLRAALARWPDDGRLQLVLARLDLLRGRDSAASARVREALRRAPENIELQVGAAETAVITGAPDAAPLFATIAGESPDATGDFLVETYRTQYALALARRGERARAESLWTASLATARRELAAGNESPTPRLELAAIAAVRGDTATALAEAERARLAGWTDARLARIDPFFAGLRAHPGFRALVARMAAAQAAMRARAKAAHPEYFGGATR